MVLVPDPIPDGIGDDLLNDPRADREPPLAVEVEELETVLCVHGSLSLGVADEADGPDCDGPDAVRGFGDK